MGFSFSDHIGLLEHFLAGRQQIVDDIDRRLLNVRGKAIGHSDRPRILTISSTVVSSNRPQFRLRLPG